MTAAHGLWPKGAATGCGSMPGTDPGEALAVVAGELPDLPHLPETPARGPGAGLVGRAAALLVDLPLELVASGWAVAGAPGVDLRRAQAQLAHDLDLLEERFAGYAGPLKLQLCGPVTLAAQVELRSGEKALADPGARRDLARSLAEGAAAHIGAVARRLPSAELLLQWDEPGLPAVLHGRVPTATGWGRLAPLAPADAQALLAGVAAAASAAGATPGFHCCAAEAPVALLARSGARFLSIDVTLQQFSDSLGEALEAGVALIAGLVPTVPGPPGPPAETGPLVRPLRALWNRIGLDPHALADVAVSPTCGLAGAAPQAARDALEAGRRAARRLLEDPEGSDGR